MNSKDLATSAHDSQKTAIVDAEKTLISAPLFDEQAVQHARPAEPLMPRYRRSWPLAIALMVVSAGLIGGIIGGVVTALYQRPAIVATTATDRTDSEARVARTEGQTAQGQSASAPTATIARSAPDAATDRETANQQSLQQTTTPLSATVADERASVADEAERNKPARRDQGEEEHERAATQQANKRASAIARESADEDEAPAVEPRQAQASLRGALDEWIAATNSRDIERQMKFYGQSVNAFYLSRNTSREAVRAEKRRVFSQADTVDVRAAAPEIKLSPDGTTATMLFRKRYEIGASGQNRRGEVLQELRWRRTRNGWRIVSERDLKVLND